MSGRPWLGLGFGERLLKKNSGRPWLGLGFGVVGHGWVCCGQPFDFFFSLNKLVTIVVKERQQGKYIFVEVDLSLIFLGLCSSCSRFV